MKLAAGDALTFVAGIDETSFLASDLHQSAVVRKLEVLGEAAGRVSKTFQEAHPGIPRSRIIGLRNGLIHGYADIDQMIVWRVTKEELPALIDALGPLIPPDEGTDAG